MKRILTFLALLGLSTTAFSAAPGGPNCGWGNMLFEGKSGVGFHFLASVFNGSSGNKTFGMSSGTNGCSTGGKLTYGGKEMLSMNGAIDEVAEDSAIGHGEALDALSASIGIKPEDQPQFNQMMHDNFDDIFTSEDITAGQVMDHIEAHMQQHKNLARYS